MKERADDISVKAAGEASREKKARLYYIARMSTLENLIRPIYRRFAPINTSCITVSNCYAPLHAYHALVLGFKRSLTTFKVPRN